MLRGGIHHDNQPPAKQVSQTWSAQPGYERQKLCTAVLVAFAAGVIGYWFKIHGYSRAGLILGFVMGPLIERYFFLSLQAYESDFMLRPITLLTLVLGTFFRLRSANTAAV